MNSTPWPTLIGDTTLGLAAVTAEWAAGKLDVKKKKYQGKEKISIFLFASYRPGKVKWRQLINLHWSAYGHFIFVFLIFGCCCCCCCWNWIFLFGVAIHPLAFINNFILFKKKTADSISQQFQSSLNELEEFWSANEWNFPSISDLRSSASLLMDELARFFFGSLTAVVNNANYPGQKNLFGFGYTAHV